MTADAPSAPPLVYLVAVGAVEPRFCRAVGWCVESLRSSGSYAGDIVIIADETSAERATAAAPSAEVRVVELDRLHEPTHERRSWEQFQIARLYVHDLLDLSGYGAVMYLDTDILAIRDINPLLAGVDRFLFAREFSPMSGPGYSGNLTHDELSLARFRRGVNSGTFVAPAGVLGGVLERWAAEIDRVPDTFCYDQSALNALVFRGEIDAAPLPSQSIGFPLKPHFDSHYGASTMLLHYAGPADDKFPLMERHHELLSAGVSPDDVVLVGTADTATGNFAATGDVASSPARVVGERGLVIAVDDDLEGVHSSSLVNQALATQFARLGHRLVPEDDAEAPDVVIHHNLARPFGSSAARPGVPRVAIRTWDFGRYPTNWIDELRTRYDQVWVPSNWVHDSAVASGLDPDRVRVVPNGVDKQVFEPFGPAADIPTSKSFRFLFVGGAVVRKGIDVLLEGYRRAFGPDDDVSLVIKDHSVNVFYDDREYRSEIEATIADPDAPDVVLIDDHLEAADLAALYRACDVGVWPYRAEGFLMPALEALGCGIPTIVPCVGPTSDFSSQRTSFLLPSRELRLPYAKTFAIRIGASVELEEIRIIETTADQVAAALREAFDTPKVVRNEMGAHGAAVAHGRFSWELAAEQAVRCLRELVPG